MLRKLKEIIGYKLSASDGDIGKTKDMLFDDQSWKIRYLVADTGGWLTGRKVVLPRVLLGEPEWATRKFPVHLSRSQVENSPTINEREPVSRQYESSLHQYLRIEPYWLSTAGGAFAMAERAADATTREETPGDTDGDPHLRSCTEVKGYHVQAADGEIGHIEDFVVDDDDWVVRYLVVDPHNILPGRKVLVAVPWFDKIDWAASTVHVDLTREQVKNSPEFEPTAPVNRRVEERLYDYYGRPSYWS
jgi:hypothetical protein